MTNSISGSPLLDTDTLIVNRDGVDYHTTRREVHPPICDFEELPGPPKPWDGNGYHYHILNNTEEMNLGWNFLQVWDVATELEIGATSTLPAGSNVVIQVTPVQHVFFDTKGNFEFGKYTDVSECRNCIGLSSPEFNTSVKHLNYTSEMTRLGGFSCAKFNQDVSHWDVSRVTDMSSMWSGCSAFNQPLDMWDVSSVQSGGFSYLFYAATAFDQDISNWCVTNQPDKPGNFDKNAGFEGQTAKQPQWGTCQ